MAIKVSKVLTEGRNLILAEKYDEAINFFKDLCEKDKDNVIFPNYLGLIYLFKEEYKTSADFFKKAIDIDPENWYSYQLLGQICRKKKIDKCAIDYFTKTLEINPSNLTALLNLAMVVQEGSEEAAVELLNSALGVDPLNLVGNYLRGNIYLKNKDFDNALKLFTNVITKNPEFQIGWYKLGFTYFKKGKTKKAIDSLIKGAQISKKPYILNLIGLIYSLKFKVNEAVAYFKESIKLKPDDPSTWINLADVYIKGNNSMSAKLCLVEAMNLLKDKDTDKKIAIWTNLAKCYELEQKSSFSLNCLEKARELNLSMVQEDLESFEAEESKMEILHQLTLKIEEYRKQGVTSQFPDDLDLKKLNKKE